MATPNVDDLTKDLTNRCNYIWDRYFYANRAEALKMAADLLKEPGLCADHQAGMHQLLACDPFNFNDDTAMHAQEVVRVDSEIVQQYHDTATMHEQVFMQTKLRFAKEHLQLVLEKKRKLDEGIAFWMSVEFVKVDAQDTQPKQAEQGEQAERPAVPEDDNNLGDMLLFLPLPLPTMNFFVPVKMHPRTLPAVPMSPPKISPSPPRGLMLPPPGTSTSIHQKRRSCDLLLWHTARYDEVDRNSSIDRGSNRIIGKENELVVEGAIEGIFPSRAVSLPLHRA